MVGTHGSSYRVIGLAPTGAAIPWMCHTYGATHLLIITEVPVQFVEVGGTLGAGEDTWDPVVPQCPFCAPMVLLRLYCAPMTPQYHHSHTEPPVTPPCSQ